MTTDSLPQLSIVLVSYNSLADLSRCLPSLLGSKQPSGTELIVVDNHGQDGVADWLQQTYPAVRLLKNPVNSGYSGGNNLGVAAANGRWTLLLNPDTVLAPDCLMQLMHTARQYPNAFINPKLLNPDGTINACGNVMHYTGITTCRGLNAPATTYTTLHRIPLLSGAALLAPTIALRQLGPFDETYFMYFEDTDLSLRARLAGYELLCDARAVVTHYYRLGMSPTKFYYLERNRLLTFGRVFSSALRRRMGLALCLTELFMWGFALRGFSYLRARFRTYGWLWTHRRVMHQMHQTISQSQRIPESDLLQDSLVNLPFEQLIGGWPGRWLNGLIGPIYRWLKPTLPPPVAAHTSNEALSGTYD